MASNASFGITDGPGGSLARAFQLQYSIVHALILQDIRLRHAKTNFVLLATLVEPMMVIAALYIIRFYVQGQSYVHGLPLVLFLVTGFLTDYCFRIVVGAVSAATQRRSSARMFPMVTSMDVIVAGAVSSCLIGVAVLILASIAGALMNGLLPSDPLLILIVGWLVLIMGIAVGMLAGVVLRKLPSLRVVVGALLRINLVLSGSAFMGSELPKRLLPYVIWNPTFHAIELIREAWFRGYTSPADDPWYIVKITIYLFAAALCLERLTRKNQIT